MLVSLCHFLEPEDMSCIEMMLFKGDAISCDCFLVQGRIIFVSHLSLRCEDRNHIRRFVVRM